MLDTGVLVGMCIEIDQHHTKCFEYVVKDDCEQVYITPTVGSEFERKNKEIREKLSQSIIEHRQRVTKKVNDDKLSRSGIRFVRDSILELENRAHRFLHEYYSKMLKNRVRVDKLEIINYLNNMEIEVWKDVCREHGG